MKRSQDVNKKNKVSEGDIEEFIKTQFTKCVKTRKIKNLIEFHTTNKYMIMAKSQKELKKMGNIVARYKKGDIDKTINEYKINLNKILSKTPTTKSHCNVIMHIFGYFSDKFTKNEKEQFLQIFEKFKTGKITIGKILSEINPIIYRFNNTYLARQTYFLLYSEPGSDNMFTLLLQK